MACRQQVRHSHQARRLMRPRVWARPRQATHRRHHLSVPHLHRPHATVTLHLLTLRPPRPSLPPLRPWTTTSPSSHPNHLTRHLRLHIRLRRQSSMAAEEAPGERAPQARSIARPVRDLARRVRCKGDRERVRRARSIARRVRRIVPLVHSTSHLVEGMRAGKKRSGSFYPKFCSSTAIFARPVSSILLD